MQILLTNEEVQDFFHSVLCNGALTYFSGYGIEVDWKQDYFDAAKQTLKAEGKSACYEDILLQLLKDGKELIFEDVEGEGDNTKNLNLATIYEKMPLVPAEYLLTLSNQEDDAGTGDIVLQTILYGEIMFG